MAPAVAVVFVVVAVFIGASSCGGEGDQGAVVTPRLPLPPRLAWILSATGVTRVGLPPASTDDVRPARPRPRPRTWSGRSPGRGRCGDHTAGGGGRVVLRPGVVSCLAG